MIFKKSISRWQQWKWFKSVNNKQNVYFLIMHQEKFIGLINGKDIDFEKRTCEGGIFIWEKDYWNTHIPVAASIILNDFNFLLANFKINYAKVLKDNKNAIDYNISQGYVICSEEKNGVINMELTKESYLEKIKRLRSAIGKLTKDSEILAPKNISFSDDSAREMKKLYTNLPEDIQALVQKIILANG